MISKSLLKKTEEISNAMNSIGIKTVDASVYTTDYIGEKASESVVVGYVPYYAAIFTVHTMACGGMVFRIDGQVRDDERYAPASGHRFGKIQRPLNTGELFGKFDFGINIYMPSTEGGDLIQKGTDFFEKFMELYFRYLEHNFTEKVILHVVPADSDEFKAYAALHGSANYAAQKYFEDRIKKKFKDGFFQN